MDIKKQFLYKPIDAEAINTFYLSLNDEKKYLSNPAQADIEFAIGIFLDSNLIAVAGIKRRLKVFRFSFHIIKEQYQGLGLSKQLTQKLAEQCTKNNISCIFASVDCTNENAMVSGQKYGYQLIYSDGEMSRFIYPLGRRGQIVKVIIPYICRLIFPIIRLFSR